MDESKFKGDTGTGGRFTAHKTTRQMEEIEESPEEMTNKIKRLADLIRNSKRCVFFTGAGPLHFGGWDDASGSPFRCAGVSTSAGIPDFRGPEGVWTLQATGKARKAKTVPMHSALPTATHMAMVKLVGEGRMQYVISQNVDGIHRKSGIHPSKLSELHGNTNLEVIGKPERAVAAAAAAAAAE